MTLWHGRFDGTMSTAMRELNHSLQVDIRLLPYDLRVNRVWAGELQRIGILTAGELRKIEQGLEVIGKEYAPVAGGWWLVASEKPGHQSPVTSHQPPYVHDEDVHSFVERRLTELAGPAGAKIHTGRSRNDQVMTDLRLYLKDAIDALRIALHTCVGALCAQAERHLDTIMPGYTHMQQAQPVSLAHYLLGAVTALRDDEARLADALRRVDLCPLGSGALAGSAYPIDRAAVAKALGFGAPTPNSMATVSLRDECLEVAAACAILMTHLSRYAEDAVTWSSQEFGFVTFADTVTTGSSMMPQKKNPDAMELIRGKAARVIGQMQTLFTLLKGLPLTYARDLQEDKPALFDGLDQTHLCCTVFTEAIATATFHVDRMRATLDPNLFATDLADYLVGKGLPFREAHAVVGTLIRDAMAKKHSIATYTVAALQKYSSLFGKDVVTCFDPAACLARRNLLGGTGPKAVAAQLADCRRWCSVHQK